MGLNVSITVDQRKLDRIARQLAAIPRALPKVISRSINRTVTAARTDATRQISASLNTTKGRIPISVWLNPFATVIALILARTAAAIVSITGTVTISPSQESF